MITVAEAKKKIDETVSPLPEKTVAISDALGCRLHKSIPAPINVPDFVSSIMDGVAFRHEDLTGAGPWRLPIQAVIGAGRDEVTPLRPGHAIKIMTGAKLIPGSDTVVKVEDVEFEDDVAVIREMVNRGNFVRPLGDDIEKGSLLFEAGVTVTPVVAGVLASVGLQNIEVIPYPRVTIISTGSEIIEPGHELRPGQRYDSNRTVLYSLLEHDGMPANIINHVIPDQRRELEQILRESMEDSDLVITSGGVSMGDFDYIPDVVARLGGEILFHKVTVKPGKPVLIARIGKSWLIGLPGNPVSVVAGYHLHARRVISRLMGKEYRPRTARARLGQDVHFPSDRFGMLGAMLEDHNGEIIAIPAVRQQSGRLSSAAEINGFIMIEENVQSMLAGETADVEWLYHWPIDGSE